MVIIYYIIILFHFQSELITVLSVYFLLQLIMIFAVLSSYLYEMFGVENGFSEDFFAIYILVKMLFDMS